MNPLKVAVLCLPVAIGAALLARGEPAPESLSSQLTEARSDGDKDAVAEISVRRTTQSPNDPKILEEAFRAQLDVEDYDRATATFARLEKTSAPPATLSECRGDLAHASGKPLDEALTAWREAAQPASTPALLGKIADALDAAGRWPEAADALRAFLKLKPDHAARTARLALCLLNAGRPEEADQQALAAGRLDAADSTVKALAPLFDRLRPQLPALRKLAGAPNARLDRALIYYRIGAFEAALADSSSAAADGRSLAPRILQAQCLWRLNRDEEAGELRVANISDLKWFDDARRCDRLRAPDVFTGREDAAVVVRAYSARAMVLLDGNQPVLAVEDAEKASCTEEKVGHRTADTDVVLAATLLRNSQPADALAAARRATDEDPRAADGWALCGRLQQEAADFPGAVASLSRALAIREDPAWLRRRETCLRVLGHNGEADRDAQRAAQLPVSS